jgi:alkylated DNA repair dioxygenase AlkB
MTENNILKLDEGDSQISFMDLPEELCLNNEGFKQLWSLKPNTKDKMQIYGKEVEIPRYQRFYGRSYYFSGSTHPSVELTDPYLLKLNAFVNEHSDKNYNQCMINFYESGEQYISNHSDDERQLVPNSSIYSFSFGATRRFIITSIKDKTKKYELPLKNNTMLCMEKEMQKYYKHGVPKQLKVKEPRINVTFRIFK